jgi:hypothetical protein
MPVIHEVSPCGRLARALQPASPIPAKRMIGEHRERTHWVSPPPADYRVRANPEQ